MKYAKWFVGFVAGMLVTMLGLFALGVTEEIGLLRMALGLALIYTATIIWDRWA